MPRDKYNPHGPNHYTPVTNPDRQLPRGPRHDLRQKHKIKDDPLDKIHQLEYSDKWNKEHPDRYNKPEEK